MVVAVVFHGVQIPHNSFIRFVDGSIEAKLVRNGLISVSLHIESHEGSSRCVRNCILFELVEVEANLGVFI